MTIVTLKERTSRLAAAKAKIAELETEISDLADEVLREAVAARRDTSDARRATRISVAAHVAREVGRAGSRAHDYRALDAALTKEGHLFPTAQSALHEAEKLIESEKAPGLYWRIDSPADEWKILSALTDNNPERIQRVADELKPWNAFTLLAVAYARVAQRRPGLFGKMSVEDERAQVEAADKLVEETKAWLRETPQVVANLCQRDGVEMRPGVDAVPDLFDAALARAARSGAP